MSLNRRIRQRSRKSQSVTRLSVESLEQRQMLDAGLPSSAQFVTALYYDLLHRSPSQADVAAWAGFLDAGHSRDDVANSFISSPGYRFNLLRQDYETLLGRDPEAGIAATW